MEGGNGAAPAEGEPTPVVKIDNQHDPFATMVTIEYGDRWGELLDTVRGFSNPILTCCLAATSCLAALLLLRYMHRSRRAISRPTSIPVPCEAFSGLTLRKGSICGR